MLDAVDVIPSLKLPLGTWFGTKRPEIQIHSPKPFFLPKKRNSRRSIRRCVAAIEAWSGETRVQ